MSGKETQDLKKLDENFQAAAAGGDLRWLDARELTIEGRGWDDTAGPFDRLPARAERNVPPKVWNLSLRTAGLAVRFITDSPVIAARWTLRFGELAMEHMAATGVSGLDLYGRFDGAWLWAGIGRPSAKTNELALVKNPPAPGRREYMLYLPLYNGVESLELGVARGAEVAPGPARPDGREKPICFYGTSITQGGCASRPGMTYPAILGRRFDRPVINLGFSGNGRMEASLAELLGELDAAAFVLDCLPNMTVEQTAERVEPFIEIVRRSRPDTPILLMEHLLHNDAPIFPTRRRDAERQNAILRETFEKLRGAGDANLHYVPADGLIGDDREATVDGSHPTDLGFMRLADGLETVLRSIL